MDVPESSKCVTFVPLKTTKTPDLGAAEIWYPDWRGLGVDTPLLISDPTSVHLPRFWQSTATIDESRLWSASSHEFCLCSLPWWWWCQIYWCFGSKGNTSGEGVWFVFGFWYVQRLPSPKRIKHPWKWAEREIHLPTIHFQGQTVSFREGISLGGKKGGCNLFQVFFGNTDKQFLIEGWNTANRNHSS